MSFRSKKNWAFLSLSALACSAASQTTDQGGPVAQTGEELVLSSNSSCTIEMTKVEYNQPGVDTSDFIELHVTSHSGLVSNLLNCGVSAIVIFDSSSCLLPYQTIAVASLTIPSDGYVIIAPGQPGVSVASGQGDEGWIHNSPGEIGVLGTAGLTLPLAWAAYGGTAKCKPALFNTPVATIQTETDSAPNYTNVSCDSTFHLVLSTMALPKTPNDCPSGGAGGAGGVGGTLGIGGLGGLGIGGIGLGGIGGIGIGGIGIGGLGIGGIGLGGIGGIGIGGLGIGGLGLGGLGGIGGLGGLGLGQGGLGGLAQGGLGGSDNGTGGSDNGTGGAVENGGSGGTNSAGYAGKDAEVAGNSGHELGGSGGGTDGEGGNAAGSTSTAGKGAGNNGSGGSESGHAGSSNAGDANVDADARVALGGGCTFSVPGSDRKNQTHALSLLLALVGLSVRRRRSTPK